MTTPQTVLLPITANPPQALDLLADTLADADMRTVNAWSRLRERYFLLDAATLAERVEVAR